MAPAYQDVITKQIARSDHDGRNPSHMINPSEDNHTNDHLDDDS